ncbi:SCP2 sterol-binding domain-containing protein [Marinobacterium sp. D7]|uniref:ubiquinone anaerobic biosynthesis accessory factor UbiT n=1 Tax=Marinobacterium ramblicola TaxID=2849041 RepID=UPI001C2D698F|nr:SCP2 sterol-binding domain-containing protein [Marinobacterium ramblicola]MBV1787498.1 SCP2 sterol-binding domain-containing protein [Marinobacterium ramblicola]
MIFLPRPPLPLRLLPRLSTNLPKLVSKAEPHLPFRAKGMVLERLLNRLFQQQLEDEEFEFMAQRQLGLEVRDLGIRLAFGYRDGRLRVEPTSGSNRSPDAWIRGDSREFIRLATLEEDPDTLFFQRRLSIEGDTELGLAVKNLLDSVDWSEMPPLFQRGLRIIRRMQG